MKIAYPIGLQRSTRFFTKILLSLLLTLTVSSQCFAQPWTITASAGTGGSISPEGAVPVLDGENQSFDITPAANYHIADILVDGISVGTSSPYSFTSVATNHTIQATFAIDTYTLSATAGANGTVSPPGVTTVNYNTGQTYAITPATGYHVLDVLVDGGSVGAVTSYTFSNVVANHTISATFAIDTYTLSATAGANGTVSPPGVTTVNYNTGQTYAITPATGYHVLDVLVDGGSVGAVTSYTFSNVAANHTISATFAINTYTLSATAGANGTVSPPGVTTVDYNTGQTYTITPATGYHVLDVLVDGGSVGALTSYTFSNVVANHTISATFAINTYTLTPTAGSNGSISPSGSQVVNYGDDLTFTITPNEGYQIWNVEVDDSGVGAVAEYTFSNVTANHTISVTFRKVVQILSVSIPNATMRIGDVISATIEVITDAGIPYTLVSGSVGGYNLYGLQRINSLTYLANFNVTSGGDVYYPAENIPVANLVLTTGTVQNSPYNSSIVQNNDLLDGQVPVIEGIRVDGGMKKIGDEVIININSDGSNYSIHPDSRINGIRVTESYIHFDDLGGGDYRLRYYVQEGNNDVAYGALTISIILIKPSGNTNNPQSSLENRGGISIDAHRPLITRMEVPSSEFGPDRTVQITVTADGEGYSFGPGTIANGVPLSSSRLIGSEHSEGLYDLSYTVSTIDQNVSPGKLEASVVLVDPAGNSSSIFSALRSNSLEVYTTRPSAVLAGTPEICSGESAQLSVFFQGRGPWTLELDDGSEITRYSSIQTNNISLNVSPEETSTYSIYAVWDRNYVGGSYASGGTEVLVNEKTQVEIVNLASGYSVSDDPVILEANVMGGEFSGPGVITSTGYFYPEIADTIYSPHTIYYKYLNGNGCKSIDSALVFVLGADGALFIPDKTVCNDSDPFLVNASNVAGTIGTFTLLDANMQVVAGLTDHGDNSATVDPILLTSGEYSIEYNYFDEVSQTLTEGFLVVAVVIPEILSLKDTYCQNESPLEIVTSVSGAIIEGPGVSENGQGGFMFDPGLANIGENTLTSTAISETGCSNSVQKVILVKFVPEVDFSLSKSCIPIDGGPVEFINLSSDKLNVESWTWTFGDPGSGLANKSNLVTPTHYYQEPGQRSISLTAKTSNGCESAILLDTLIGEMPVANLTWVSDCYSEESAVEFFNLSAYKQNDIVSSQWTFKTISGQQLGTVNSSDVSEIVSFSFPETDAYKIDLHILNTAGCSDSITKELFLRPTIQLTGDSYLDNFNSHDGLWTIHSENQIESWVWGEPGFNGLEADPGNRAWFTQLLPNLVGYKENSWIQSPCFDFTETTRPIVQMDILRSFVPLINGAVLQYREGVEDEWKTVGADTPGVGWYNSDNILNLPGGSSKGWSLNVFNPDREWVRAIHDVDELIGKPHITLRVAIAANGAQGIGNEGFALDNFSIAERSKLTVLEYFTNSSDVQCLNSDQLVDSISGDNSRDMIDLQYHMDYPGNDPMNENNPFPASTRSFYHGVPQVPYAILNGGNSNDYRYDFTSTDSSMYQGHIKLATLEIPELDLVLFVDWMEDRFEASTEVKCQVDGFSENIQLYIVVFETSVTAYTGDNSDTHFRNVVLDMLPSPAGKLIGSDWVLDSTITIMNSWTYKEYVEDKEELAIAAFIQDRNTGRIIQSAVKYRDGTVSIEKKPLELSSLHIYPNPAKDYIHINLGTTSENSGRFEIIDMNGRVVMIEQIPPGYQIYQLDIQHLIRGMYILHWYESDQIRAVNKIIKIR